MSHRELRFPADLASAVYSLLQLDKPSEGELTSLFEMLFFASLETEEGRGITSSIVCLDPANPDPDPPGRIVRDRWSVSRLAQPVEMDISSLAKLAPAADPSTSALAVYPDVHGRWQVWGLIDQERAYYAYSTLSSRTGPERPGVFSVAMTGPGQIEVYSDYLRVAALRRGDLIETAPDAVKFGPIAQKLSRGITRLESAIRDQLLPQQFCLRPHWPATIRWEWQRVLARILIEIRVDGHGGALIVHPTCESRYLRIKYLLKYDRIPKALECGLAELIRSVDARDEIFAITENKTSDVPQELYWVERGGLHEWRDSQSELNGAIGFVASLAKVDGAVVVSPDLVVHGFGAEIRANREPEAYAATDADPDDGRLRRLDYEHFGTRHRSMLRLCASESKAVGFVVSADGPVRAITKHNGKVILWDDIQLERLGSADGVTRRCGEES